MANKEFTSYRGQLKILRNRGMDIPVGTSAATRAANILRKENYYCVVNGYKDSFLNSTTPEKYLSKTTLDDLFSVFEFDRSIRLIYIKYMLKIEHQIKSVIAYEFSKQYGHDNYLKIGNFDPAAPQKDVFDTICLFQSSLANQIGKNDAITHYVTTYGYVPLWVLINIVTLGNISYFYKYMKPADKNSVASVFKIQPQEMSKYLKNLTLARNICAHDERFYDLVFKSSVSPTSVPNFNLLSIPVLNGNPTYGVKDLYSLAVIFTQFLPKSDLNKFVKEMDAEFALLKTKIKNTQYNNIMAKMGYGPNWKNLLLLY